MDDFNLEDVRIASPCKASWRKMKGDDRVRNCAKCSLNVYNISEMTREEAAELIANTEGRLCIRLWRRRDGTVITKDCPMEFRQIRYGIAVCSSIILGVILATMQWTRLFTSQEMDLIEKKKDLEAGGFGRGRVIKLTKSLPAGYRIHPDDVEFAEIGSRMIPLGAMYRRELVVGMRLAKDIQAHSVLTQSDIDSSPSVTVSGDADGVELGLTPEEILQVDDIAKAKKTSVSKLMREWISQRIKRNERH
ncbi:MAG: SAF domain-containing protein [Candidatus Melainabacteria bacterium]|nr:SAF domain-containing protein [Candidatus Melainabacteria bacterium]